MRWHNGGNEKVRIWSIFNTLFVHMERKCGERKRPTCFYLFYNKKDFFFFPLLQEIHSRVRWGRAFCFGNGYIFFKLSLYYIFLCFIPKHEKYMFFFFLFHLLNNWGKRKKTQNLIEIWFSCAIYNQLWVEDFMND